MAVESSDNREWVTEPLQARSQETLTRLLDAADELLREQAFDDVTVADIVRRAERTVGSFYARFADKNALVRTLVQRVIDELIDDMRVRFSPEQWRTASMRDIVSSAVSASANVFWRHAHISRAALVLAARDDEARRFRSTNYQAFANAVVSAMKTSVAADAEMPGDDAIRDAIEVVTALLDTRLLYVDRWQPGSDMDIDIESEIAEITDICFRVLELT